MIVLAPFTKAKLLATSTTSGRTKRLGKHRTKIRTYFELEEDSIEGYTWLGASEIVRRYDFTFGSSFHIVKTTPMTTNCCICISWVVSNGVMARYKLVGDNGELLYAPNYTSDITIPSVFSLEIWSTDNETLSWGGDVFKTGKLVLPTTLCAGYEDIELLLNPDECTDDTLILEGWNPSEGCYFDIEGLCGSVASVCPGVFSEDGILLLANDGTLHSFFVKDDGFGNVTYFIDQDPSVGTEFEYAMTFNLGTYKLGLLALDDGLGGTNYALTINEYSGAQPALSLFVLTRNDVASNVQVSLVNDGTGEPTINLLDV